MSRFETLTPVKLYVGILVVMLCRLVKRLPALVWWRGVGCFYFSQDKIQWWDFINIRTNIWVTQKQGFFLAC